VHLPRLSQPFSCDFHPDHRRIMSESRDWVVKRLLPGDDRAVRDLRAFQAAFLVTTGYPLGKSDRLLDLVNLGEWWFLIDDEFTRLTASSNEPEGEVRARAEKFVADLWDLISGGSPDGLAWPAETIHELIDRIRGKVSARQFENKVVWAFDTFHRKGLLDQLDSKSADAVDPLATHLATRFADGACLAWGTFIEYALDMDLDSDFLDDPLVKSYENTIMECWVIPNEILSFRKECFHNDHHNAVCLLRQLHGMGLDAALEHLAARLGEQQQLALKKYAHILTTYPDLHDDARSYLQNLQTIAAANQRWSYVTPRYHGECFRWNGMLTGELTLYPDYTQFPATVGD
jgi:hypothetical protein